MFGESYNKICKKSQMNLHVRYWDDRVCEVRTSYWTFEFLGKASEDDMLSEYDACVSQLNKSKILHIPSDDPNVNLAFLDLVHESKKGESLEPLINIRACSMYTLHRSFQSEEKATDYNIKILLF